MAQELDQTEKRDYLKSLEKKYQGRWQSERLFEVDAPSPQEIAGLSKAELDKKYPKWFGSISYPYMNGSLHLGHAFTISKIEFAAGYERMLGKRVLFPHAFHVTGMPIKATADKIIREMELFGQDFERFEEVQAEIQRAAEAENPNAKDCKPPLYQFQIMEATGVPRAEIKKFTDPLYWTKYYPPIAIADHHAFGSRIDWRRAFVSIDINPYHDSFIRWGFNKLYKLGKIKFGERYTIYSPKDDQPCEDHERSDGEGIRFQEFTAVKMEIVSWRPDAKEAIESKVGGRKVFLIVPTLHPETLYSQTNCFVGLYLKYGIFAANDREAYVCTYRAIRNMTFQGIITPRGEINQLLELTGAQLVGSKVKAPLAVNPDVLVLALDSILATEGTGIVTSVPSSSRDSNETLMDLEHTGESVQDARPKAREALIKAGLAFAYAEPEGFVLTRTGDECVVALMEMWYCDYGEERWTKQVEELVKGMKMNTCADETRRALETALPRSSPWSCARTTGLGSKLPWDPRLLIEPLSDATIHMIYYTVAHLLHPTSFTGSEIGPLGITPDQLTDEIWEYIFSDGPFPSPSPLPKEKVDKLKHEFEYFYPLNAYSTARDLISNHLTFILYNHAALLAPKYFPLNMRSNALLLLNGKKMAKSTGNSVTLKDMIDKFGADASRLCLADTGDGMKDGNFDEKCAYDNVLKVHALLEWCEEMFKDQTNMRQGPRNYHDDVFEQEINELINITQGHYEAMNYKEALKSGFYELQKVRDWYREVSSVKGMHVDLIKYWIRTATLLITPIAPHFAEHIWSSPTMLNEPKSIQLALWPTPDKPANKSLLASAEYMRGTVKSIRDAESDLVRMLAEGKSKKRGLRGLSKGFDPKREKAMRIYVATKFPEWQDECAEIVQQAYVQEENKVDDVKVKELLGEKGLINDARVMPFIEDHMEKYSAQTTLDRTLPFSESEVLHELAPYLKHSLALSDIEILSAEQARRGSRRSETGFLTGLIEDSEPGAPAFEYRNVTKKEKLLKLLSAWNKRARSRSASTNAVFVK